jgi:hypothetical protein
MKKWKRGGGDAVVEDGDPGLIVSDEDRGFSVSAVHTSVVALRSYLLGGQEISFC